MRPGAKNTRKLGEALTVGFSVDRILMTIVKIRRLGYIQSEDRVVIGDALLILQQVLRKGEWADIKGAFSSRVRTVCQIPSHINKLIGITNSLLEKSSVEKEQIQLLEEFFTAYSRLLLQRTNSL